MACRWCEQVHIPAIASGHLLAELLDVVERFDAAALERLADDLGGADRLRAPATGAVASLLKPLLGLGDAGLREALHAVLDLSALEVILHEKHAIT